MIMVNEFKLAVAICMRVELPLDQKRWKIKTGPPGRHGPRAAGPSRAVDRGLLGLRVTGPLGRRRPWAAGRWAAGLAKPRILGSIRRATTCFVQNTLDDLRVGISELPDTGDQVTSRHKMFHIYHLKI